MTQDQAQMLPTCPQCGTVGLSLLPDGFRLVSVEQIETVERVLGAAWQDIHEWVRLAREQRAASPDPDHAPNMPSEAGIAKSREIIAQIGRASRLAGLEVSDV